MAHPENAVILGLLLVCVAFVAVFVLVGCRNGKCGSNIDYDDSPFKPLWEHDEHKS